MKQFAITIGRRSHGMVVLVALCAWASLSFALRPDDSYKLARRAPGRHPAQPREATGDQFARATMAAQAGIAVEWDNVLRTPMSVRGTRLGSRQPFSGGTGTATLVSGDHGANALVVMDNLSGIFGLRDATTEFKVAKIECDSLGFHHVRLRQIYNGLRVVGGDLVVHFDRADDPYQVNGRYVADIAVDVVPALSADEAVAATINDPCAVEKIPVRSSVTTSLVVFALNSAPRLAYVATVEDRADSALRWRYYIDAGDGSVLLRHSLVKMIAAPTANGVHANITGTILAGENGQAATMPVWFETASASFYLYNTNQRWYVYNVASSGYPDANTYAFRTTNAWGTSDRSAMSLSRNFAAVENYFRTVHGLNSFNGAGIYARANVHEGTSYVNAYWDSTDFHFGDGDNVLATSLCTLDIAGHEFTHAVDEYSADLIYANESGALNESFSDIFGALVEFHAQPDGRGAYPSSTPGYADWLCGEDCWLVSEALRDLRNPANTSTIGAGNQQPSRYHGTYWDPYEEVHQNDGVQNFFFYLLAEGGTGTNDGLPYAVAGIGIENAGSVAYRALTVYCTPSTGFRAGRSAWISAAHDLNTNWIASVKAAWDAVGVGSLATYPMGGVQFSGSIGGPFAPSMQTLVLSNFNGPATLAWSLTSPAPWLVVSPQSGIVPAMGASTVGVSIAVLASGMGAGTYLNAIRIDNLADGTSELVPVTFTIWPPPILSFPLNTNPGWSVQGQWAFGKPQGIDGDPSGGFTGTNVYGYNLAGSYSNSMVMTQFLTTSALNFGDYRNVCLKFRRWLGVERAYYDDAVIQVSRNGTVWSNVWVHADESLQDTSWRECSYDISAVADKQATVYVRWGMGPTDSSVEYCGWNIDDIVFLGVAANRLAITPPDGFSASGYEGGPFAPTIKKYALTNQGSNSLPWTATAPGLWLDVSPSGGTLLPGQSEVVNVTIGASAASLGTGTYAGHIVFSNMECSAAMTRPAQIVVMPIPGDIAIIDSIAPYDDLLMPFGALTTFCQHVEHIVITNRDPVHALLVTSIQSPTGTFSIAGGPATFPTSIAPGAACDFDVVFTPCITGYHAATIMVNSSDSNEPSVAVGLDVNYTAMLDPIAPGTVREHQVLLRQLTGRECVQAVACDASAVVGEAFLDTNAWRFSCVPAFNTAGQVWHIAFIGMGPFGVQTQVVSVTVAKPAKGIMPKKPLLFEDVDGDLLDFKYSGIKDGSRLLFDGQAIVVSNAVAGGKLAFGIKPNKVTGNGTFDVRDVRMDGDAKSISLAGDVDNVSMADRRVDAMKFAGKGAVVSNVTLGSAKSISVAKGTVVGTVAVSNGFKAMSMNEANGARIMTGVPADAHPSNTPARAGFKTVNAATMRNSVVAGRDAANGDKIVQPVVKAKTVSGSTLYRTDTNSTIHAAGIQ